MTTDWLSLFFIRCCGWAAARRALIPYLMASIIVGSASGAHTEETSNSAPIILGALYNLTGFQSELDVPSSRGARLAVSEINRDGGVLGRQLRLVLVDGESQPEVLRKKTITLLKQNPSTIALMGLSDTDMVLGAAPTAAANGKLFLTSGATSPRLPGQVPRYLFLACFGDNVQAAAAAEWAHRTLHAQTGAIIYDATKTYTRLLQGYFRTGFEELGGRVLSVRGYTKKHELGDAIRAIGKPDLVYLSVEAPEEIVNSVRELRATGFSGPILGGDSYDSNEPWRQHPKIGGVYFTTHAYLGRDNADPKIDTFRKAYSRAYQGRAPNAFAALGYDTVHLLVAAINRARSAVSNGVLDALAGTDGFEGVTGVIGYLDGSRIPRKSVSLLRIEHGRFSSEQRLVPSRVPPP